LPPKEVSARTQYRTLRPTLFEFGSAIPVPFPPSNYRDSMSLRDGCGEYMTPNARSQVVSESAAACPMLRTLSGEVLLNRILQQKPCRVRE
jgi:hypothetical protein